MISLLLLGLLLPLQALADCPSGAIFGSSFNKCYKFVNQPVTFLAAEQFCQGLGGHLVALENGFETSFVVGFVLRQNLGVKSFWIGANYLSAPTWAWTYDTPFAYSNWAPGQPADPSINQCGSVRDSDNFWTKELCNSQKPFVCSISPNSQTCPLPVCSGSCPTNYTMSPTDCRCYYWHPVLATYNDSLSYCQSQGASLVKITTAAQNKWLANWLISLGVTYNFPWIGLTCPGTTRDSCYWGDGSQLSCYDNFDFEFTGRLSEYDGTNPTFFIRLVPTASDFGTWLRDLSYSNLFTVCMRDSS